MRLGTLLEVRASFLSAVFLSDVTLVELKPVIENSCFMREQSIVFLC